MGRNPGIKLSAAELAAMFADPAWAAKFPPVLDVSAAAELAQVTPATIYDWSSRGLLHQCAKRRGKRLKFLRDRFIKFLFE